jgi:hypothetical protein
MDLSPLGSLASGEALCHAAHNNQAEVHLNEWRAAD